MYKLFVKIPSVTRINIQLHQLNGGALNFQRKAFVLTTFY